jgi:hypothetical protein
MSSHRGGNTALAARRVLAVTTLLALATVQVHAENPRKLARSQPLPEAAAVSTVVATPTSSFVPAEDQLATLYAKIQAENDKILETQGQIADALDRNANLLGVTIGVSLLLSILFAGILLSMRRAAKGSIAAARALPTLERAYVFLGKHISVTLQDTPGVSAAVDLKFQTSFTNHGRTPAVVRWINVDHHYLREAPSGEYEDHERHGVGIVIGAGDTLALGDGQLMIPRSEWQKARAGDGAIYLDGRIVYRDIFSAQHETYFCWRYDVASRAFVVVESEALNRYD